LRRRFIRRDGGRLRRLLLLRRSRPARQRRALNGRSAFAGKLLESRRLALGEVGLHFGEEQADTVGVGAEIVQPVA
jgi:hypothetical protein